MILLENNIIINYNEAINNIIIIYFINKSRYKRNVHDK